MDVSDLRKRILRALDDARKDEAGRRTVADRAAREYEEFLEKIGVPLVRQSVTVLKAAGHSFMAETPAGSARIVSEASPQHFLEFELGLGGGHPHVLGRVSLARGRRGVVVEERPLGDGKPIGSLTEDDVTAFLVDGIPKLVTRP